MSLEHLKDPWGPDPTPQRYTYSTSQQPMSVSLITYGTHVTGTLLLLLGKGTACVRGHLDNHAFIFIMKWYPALWRRGSDRLG